MAAGLDRVTVLARLVKRSRPASYVAAIDVADVVSDDELEAVPDGQVDLRLIPSGVPAALLPAPGAGVPLAVALVDIVASADARSRYLARTALEKARGSGTVTVVLDELTPETARAWDVLFEVSAAAPEHVLLIGGQMMALLCAEAGVRMRRFTVDVDIVVNVRALPAGRAGCRVG